MNTEISRITDLLRTKEDMIDAKMQEIQTLQIQVENEQLQYKSLDSLLQDARQVNLAKYLVNRQFIIYICLTFVDLLLTSTIIFKYT